VHPAEGYVAQWQQALRARRGETGRGRLRRRAGPAADHIDELTGRDAEAGGADHGPDAATAGATGWSTVHAIEGMAGVDKTQLAVS
jgi:hypothetical protein